MEASIEIRTFTDEQIKEVMGLFSEKEQQVILRYNAAIEDLLKQGENNKEA